MADSVFHKDFKAMPWWWEWWHPTNALSQDPPRKTEVLVIGAGYGGLSTALELARSGVEVTVLERGAFGVGASTRNGGGVSGGTTLGKGFSGKGAGGDPEGWKRVMARMLADAADSLAQVETVIRREGIECHWRMTGRFSGAFTPRHYAEQAARVGTYNEGAALGTYMVPRERQREEIASDYYYGGMVVERTGQLHPALYYGGLLAAAQRAGARLCAECDAERIERRTGGFRVLTSKGAIEAREVVVATNGYTTDLTPTLRRRLVPVASHIIATEELPEDLVRSLIPKYRVVSDTKRVLCYYRQSPDSKRVIFGGRARFTQVSPEVSAPVLHRYMVERWPQLAGTKVTHAWTGNVAFAFDYLPHMGTAKEGREQGVHYLMACNGSGVAMMSYLGYQTARKIVGGSNAPANAFDERDFPTVPFYSGNPWFLPLIGAWYRTRDWWDRTRAG
ncbi:MAG: NAD(P)/FAD-dependent oxidoreductase [Reyranella sp.]|uniref:NAD(P)/FAD-dependent oxidoreductase n=1 Tax=Reyranella sp. TaxID=1929291 RepID=UPI003D1405CD